MIYLINKERQHNEPSASTSGFSRSKGDNVDAPDDDNSADEDLVWQQFDLTSGQTNHFLGRNSKRTPRYLPRGDSHPLPLALDNQDLENHLQENEPTHVIY
jgi:hypothetical protein